ncbi:hypothetical protein AMIS_29410 [Actinoplanes missouriensis 431]|uniref:Uncharacterized protein n=1 Tax=Actinoplanes missouriensis (strain ATCC 14538 / DSM 43046 / CBS 188.64 / JCM 3121 / NBRC 102363 / NCIMB 12654 / NRRL B-3342 / UNCC 431) TaxID=512565 RepID=I0H574_ACTM4|nr:hypothetical protein [Actinoplanes missouriensis]BAL88161.1 hypothetical protein AMIS_29410 [Actinoplanes missouriensis 431]
MGGPPPDAVEEALDAVSEILNSDRGWRDWWQTSGSPDLVALLRYGAVGDATGEAWVRDGTVEVELVLNGSTIKRLTTTGLHEEARSAVGRIVAVAQQNMRMRPHPALPTIAAIEQEIREIYDDE